MWHFNQLIAYFHDLAGKSRQHSEGWGERSSFVTFLVQKNDNSILIFLLLAALKSFALTFIFQSCIWVMKLLFYSSPSDSSLSGTHLEQNQGLKSSKDGDPQPLASHPSAAPSSRSNWLLMHVMLLGTAEKKKVFVVTSSYLTAALDLPSVLFAREKSPSCPCLSLQDVLQLLCPS